MRFLLTLYCILIPILIHAQELRVNEYRSDPLDISAREHVVKDANGDPCSLIKARSGMQGITFTADLGIRKQEVHEGEYWLWVPPGTGQITMTAPDLPTLEFEMPGYTEEYVVYIIIIAAILPDKVIYENMSTVVFRSNPDSADVYIDDVYFGKSPLTMSLPARGFSYRLEKKRYLPLSDTVSMTSPDTLYDLRMEKDYNSNRFFISGSIGINTQGTILPAISFGVTGKRGFYIFYSRSFPLKVTKIQKLNEREWEPSYPRCINENYYFGVRQTFYRDHRIIIGLWSQLSEKYSLNTGLGYAQTDLIVELNKIPCGVIGAADEIIYGNTWDELAKGVAINLGLVYRFKNKFQLTFDGNAYFNLRVSGGFTEFQALDGFIGIGYIF